VTGAKTTSKTNSEDTTNRVTVGLEHRAYDILIGPGLLGRAGDLIAERYGRRKLVIVTDQNVDALHGAALQQSLDASGLATSKITLFPGEATKSFSSLEQVVDFALGAGLERGDLLVAFGGGVIGDLAGFAAAIALRGVDFVQIPTSLLAQVDSSVGGKTGINTPRGKNLVGAFHQPGLVLADTDTLKTLPERELRAGYAEIVKYGLIGDASFFAWLEANGSALLAGDRPARIHAIRTACEAKADYVARDEREHGVRALLNLGHTFGHVLEAAAEYDGRLIHGEAIAIGMVLAAQLSADLGLCGADVPERIKAHLENVQLPTQIGDIPGQLPDADKLIGLMQQDKKVRDGKLNFIMLHDIGSAFVTNDIPDNQLHSFMTAKCSQT
jgi:3-dehydroquinate synthase